MLIRKLTAAALLLACLPLAAHDDDDERSVSRSIDETRPLKAEGALYVSNVAGIVEIQAWDKNEVRVTGELGGGEQKLEISGDASSLHVEVVVPRQQHDVEDTLLRLRVPAGARVEVEAVSADVAVQDVKGAVHVQSVSGDVSLDVDSQEVEAQTVSGSLTLRAPSRVTRVNTVSGDLHLAGVREKLTLETVSGDVDVEGDAISEMQLKTVSGDMNIEAALAAAPKVTAESLSGEIRLYLPREPDAQITLHSFSGELQSAYGPPMSDRGRKRYEATLGGGKGRIELTSFSGDIRLSKGRH